LVTEGDQVEADQPVLELETDKATVEVPSSVSGTVKEVHVHEGDSVEIGQLILTVEGSAEEADKPAKAVAEAGEAAPATEAEAEEPIEAVEDKKAAGEEAPSEEAAQAEKGPDRDRSRVPAAPNVRRLAREIGVDITQVEGSGPNGRITMEDVKRKGRERPTEKAAPAPAAGAPARALPDFSKWGQVRREAMSNVRRTTAEHLSHAWSVIPHVTQFDKADVQELEELRKRYGPRAEEAGGKLTVTAIMIKVVAAALKEFPQFNASIDMENKEVVYKDYYHIGIAVDTDRGLLVPVIRDVNRKSIIDLSVELMGVAEKARNRKLSLEEMQGGNFSITNLGGIGGTNFAPVVNWPEVAILGIARSRIEPVYQDGRFEPRLMLPLALSYDHRLIDGADGIRFLRWIVEALEDPISMSLQAW
jgi:pyruvate dehydrogenase E2 component (dihydrolipoamide acetyltransferase)